VAGVTPGMRLAWPIMTGRTRTPPLPQVLKDRTNQRLAGRRLGRLAPPWARVGGGHAQCPRTNKPPFADAPGARPMTSCTMVPAINR
jgi:hypothetical protein